MDDFPMNVKSVLLTAKHFLLTTLYTLSLPSCQRSEVQESHIDPKTLRLWLTSALSVSRSSIDKVLLLSLK